MIHNVFGKLITGVILAVLYVGLAGCPEAVPFTSVAISGSCSRPGVADNEPTVSRISEEVAAGAYGVVSSVGLSTSCPINLNAIPVPATNVSELCDAAELQGSIRPDFNPDATYTIDSEAAFQSLAGCYTDPSSGRTFTVQETLAASYSLTKDLDFTETPNFIPIGADTLRHIAAGIGSVGICLGSSDNFRGFTFPPRFTGTFDGGGFTISNVTIRAEATSAAALIEESAGLFGIVTGTVRNLNVSNIRVVGAVFVGAIAGKNDRGTIENVSVSNGTICGVGCGVKAGGLVGQNFGTVSSGVVTDINVVGTICAGDDIGGLVGHHFGSIVNSSATVQANTVNTVNTGSDTSARICGTPVRGGSACDAIGAVTSGRTILGSSGSIDQDTNDNTNVTIEPNTAPPPPDE